MKRMYNIDLLGTNMDVVVYPIVALEDTKQIKDTEDGELVLTYNDSNQLIGFQVWAINEWIATTPSVMDSSIINIITNELTEDSPKRYYITFADNQKVVGDDNPTKAPLLGIEATATEGII